MPLQAAMGEEDRSAHMLVNVLAVVRHLGSQRQLTPCNVKESKGHKKASFETSSVVIVAESVCENALSAWAIAKSYRIDELDALPDY